MTGDEQLDPRITVINRASLAPPCQIAIQFLPFFSTWSAACTCGTWLGRPMLGWSSRDRATQAATTHLRVMDERRQK